MTDNAPVLTLDHTLLSEADALAFLDGHRISQGARTMDPKAQIVGEFKTRFHDTGLFHDPFAGPKFANYFFHAYEEPLERVTLEAAHQRIEEAQLFIEAAHALYNRTTSTAS